MTPGEISWAASESDTGPMLSTSIGVFGSENDQLAEGQVAQLPDAASQIPSEDSPSGRAARIEVTRRELPRLAALSDYVLAPLAARLAASAPQIALARRPLSFGKLRPKIWHSLCMPAGSLFTAFPIMARWTWL